MGFTQAICNTCWEKRNPDRPAIRVAINDEETCCYCGNLTRSGIYIRVDPTTVPYPQQVTR